MSRMRRLLVAAVAAALAISTLALTASAGTAQIRQEVRLDADLRADADATSSRAVADAEVRAEAKARTEEEAPTETEEEETRTYQVTITNLTEGQSMTPFVVATHEGALTLFDRDLSASNGLQQLAENGGVPVLVEELAANPAVLDVQVAASAEGPVAPGGSVTVDVTADAHARWITLAGMLICTNDGFAGVSNVKVPSDSRTLFGYAYDAGTEINTEAYADLVPPCDGLGMTDVTNPELAENGVVHRHPGISGIADLDPAVHGWTGAVIKVEIELIG